MQKSLRTLTALAACVFTVLTPALAAAALAATQGSSVLDLNLPALGSAGSETLSPADEYRLGTQLMTRVRADPTYLNDPEISEYLGRLGYQLVSHAHTSTYNFEFFAIRDETLNAFALPGGYIAMHTGTIIAAQSESELAGVLAHEISHVAQRHIARMIEGQRSNLAITLGSVLLAILAARAGGSSGGNAAAAIAMGSQAAMIQSQLNYSQNAEREADRMGIATLYSAGFDPHGMEDFFSRLQSTNRYYRSAAPAYLSTHPLTTERMADMENRTRQIPARMHVDSPDFKLVQVRARVVQETNWDGWTKLSQELTRERAKASGREACVLDYGISVAQGFLKNADAAYAYAQKAMTCGIRSPILERNLTRTEFNAAKTPQQKTAALSAARAAMNRYPLSGMMTSNYVDILYSLGRHEELINFLRNGTALSEGSSTYHALLARSYEALGKKSLQYMHTGEMYAQRGQTEAAVYQYDLAQKANDGDFYVMSEIDARLRELRRQFADEQKDR